MSNRTSPQLRYLLPILMLFLALGLAGCSHCKTNRGHLFRCDWAFEYNRTPWIGCQSDSGCGDENEEEDEDGGLFGCFKKDGDGHSKKHKKGFRRHCGLSPDCTAKEPCCKTLGCGMWIDPSNPASLNVGVGGIKACGLTPFCTPAKPCGLTPNCGRPTSGGNLNTQTAVMLGNQGMNLGMNQWGNRGVTPPALGGAGTAVAGTAAPTLVQYGVVPGASRIATGGVVAAIGVATPAGTMTPYGVRLPNGSVNNTVVLRACGMTQTCSPAHPCGMTPGCGGGVSVAMVAKSPNVLASGMQIPGMSGGVAQAGLLVNPMTNQPVNGLTMSGYPQTGYPPIGYAPTGYSPGYPRYDGVAVPGATAEEELQAEEEAVLPETKSQMPVPRFHPIPSKPAFQRSEGLQSTPKPKRSVGSSTAEKTSASNGRKIFSDDDLDAALDQAYLEGVSAAMDEVEQELDQKDQEIAKAKLQEKILKQAQKVQKQLELKKEQELQAQKTLEKHEPAQLAAGDIAEDVEVEEAVEEEIVLLPPPTPRRLPAPARQPAEQIQSVNYRVPPPVPQQNVGTPPGMLQSAKSFGSNFFSSVNETLSPLLGSNQPPVPRRVPAVRQPAPVAAKPVQTKTRKELAATAQELPAKPPLYRTKPKAGLTLEEESDSIVQQAQYIEEKMPQP